MNWRRLISESASLRPNTSFSRCVSSVTRSTRSAPAQATSTATPWINDHSQGCSCPSTWSKINVCCHAEPIPWLITVKTMLTRNGAQSW